MSLCDMQILETIRHVNSNLETIRPYLHLAMCERDMRSTEQAIKTFLLRQIKPRKENAALEDFNVWLSEMDHSFSWFLPMITIFEWFLGTTIPVRGNKPLHQVGFARILDLILISKGWGPVHELLVPQEWSETISSYVGKWLATDPEILMMDEPTAGVDIGTKGEILDLVRSIANSGKSVILISSELPELLSVSDRILVMKDGRVSKSLDRKEIPNEEYLQLAIQGAS